MDAAAMAPFTVSEAFSLLSFGINPQEFYVTMESDKYICVREKTPYDCVVIIDMSMANQPVRKYMAADSAIMNPTSKLLAVKVQLPGTTQDHLQLLNIEKEQVKSHHMHEKIVFLKWLTPKMLGLVTQTSVYHWSTEGGSNPVKKFDRTANLIYNQIIDYRCDPAEKWLALIGIAPGSAESPHVVKGNMQLFSVDQQRTQEFEAHAASFVSFTFPGNEKPSTLLCYSSRIATAGHITSRLYVIELGALLGKPGFQKKEADLFFPQDFADDLPVSMQISDKYGLIYVITTLGLLFVYDLETATPIYWNQISGDAIIATSKASLGGGFYVVNCRGQVLLATVNEAAIVPFVSGQVNNIELAVNLAKRGNLPGAENLVVQQFHNLFSQRRYNEAAGLAAESPHGLLRTPDTIARFQSVHVWRGQTPPLLFYFEALLGRGKLDADESIKLSQLLVDQNKEDILEIWLDEDKLECSQDLGDLLESVNYDLAQKVYAKAEGTSETVDDICEQMSHLKFDKNDPSFETKAMAAVENELSSIIGMKDLKLQLRNWAKVMILNEKRRSLGINLGKRKLPHIAFLGNPGTGKTMVARILGRILNMVGILPTDHVIEVQRTDLIGEYIGQTGPKTKAKIEEAEGGILFVDEAYRLVVESEKSQDYGKEALEEIMSVMEDGNIVVIFAGYAEAMKKVIASNEGFTRRVSKFFTFTDYDPMDLAEIVHVKMTKQSEKSHFYGFKLDPSCSLEAIKDLISRETTEKQRNKLNGGLADLMLTNALEKLDLRLDFGTTDKNELLTITMQDLENGIRSLAQCQGGEGKEETHAVCQSASDTPNHGNEGRTQQEENHIAYQSALNTTNYGYEGRTQQDHHIAYQSAFDTRNFGNEGRTQQEDQHFAFQSAFYNPHSVDEGRTQHNGHNIAYQSPFNNPNYGDERRAQHNDYNITYQSSFNNPNYGNEGRTQHEDHHVAFQSPFNIPIYGNEVRTQQDHHNPYQSAFNTPNYGNEGRTQHEDHHIAYQSPLYGNEVRTQQEDHHNPYQSAFNTPNYGNEGRTQQSPFYGF